MKTSIKWILAVVLAVLAVLMLWFLGHVTWIAFDGLTDENYRAHVAVVKGQSLEGGKLSPTVLARLDRTFEIYNRFQAKNIIVSGGPNFEGDQETVKMGQYLVKRGIPKEVIFVDPLGDNFFQTASQAQRILSPYEGLRSIVIIGSWYDILRSKQAYAHCGFLAVYGVQDRYFSWGDLWRHLPEEVFQYYPGIFKQCPAPIVY